MNKIIIYIDMDGVLADYHKRHREQLALQPSIAYPQSQYDFFRKLEPIKDAIETYKWLDQQEQFDVNILTAPSVFNAWSYTDKRIWVENHLGIEACHNMIISPKKHRSIGDYLIDDNNIGKGQDKFMGELIHFHKERNNWTKIKDYFEKKYILDQYDKELPTQ
jgi:5'(3')-deoxyribonucleotidase